MTKVDLFLKEVADKNYDRFLNAGHAIEGNNGPYNFKDTPVRNTGHWLIVYIYLHKITGDNKYEHIAKVFANFLVTKQAESKSGAIECMSDDKFDHLNGLIGQAWVIEALIYGAKAFNDDSYYECAKKIFMSQSFVEETQLWKRVEIDGKELDYDYTTNHQVWFAIAGLMILDYKKNAEIERQVNGFLHIMEKKHFLIHGDGLIRHYLDIKRPITLPKSIRIKIFLKNLCIPMKKKYPNKYDRSTLEKGYHLFELYGYAIIALYRPSCTLFKTTEFKKALDYGLNIRKLNKIFNTNYVLKDNSETLLKLNRFTYGYNSPAFEYPLIEKVFTGKSSPSIVDNLLDIQKELTYDEYSGTLNKNNYDCETLTARIYEYVRYRELCDLM